VNVRAPLFRYRVLALATVLLFATTVTPLAQAPQGSQTITVHIVQRGETLYEIATMYGLQTTELAAFNGIIDANSLLVGQRLVVPLSADDDVPATSITVRAGDTLSSIAEATGVALEQLASLNAIEAGDQLYIGQTLVLPVQTAPISGQPAISLPSEGERTTEVRYSVQPGDTLYKISQQFEVTIESITLANAISDPTRIFAGQVLIIPGVTAPAIETSLSSSIDHIDIDPALFIEGRTGVLTVQTPSPSTLTGTYLDHEITFLPSSDSLTHVALVPTPVFTTSGVYPVNLGITNHATGDRSEFSFNVRVVDGLYGFQTIALAPDKLDLLSPEAEAPELSVMRATMGVFRDTRDFSGPFALPAAAPMNAPFGAKRSYNGGDYDRFHTGTDFAGAPGTQILAPAGGKVVAVNSFSVRGNTTIIDHGWGVYTVYCHQQDIYVQVGETVTTGQTIGTVGASGRTTGAHLHWELWVNGVPVDPMQWVQNTLP
jgi:murein DD-endopeptidase MepM/ murein hydrolase activator NlpD